MTTEQEPARSPLRQILTFILSGIALAVTSCGGFLLAVHWETEILATAGALGFIAGVIIVLVGLVPLLLYLFRNVIGL